MRTLTDLSQLTKSMVKKSVEEPKPAPKMQESPVDREAAEVLAYFARPGGNAPQRPHVAAGADPTKDRVAELEAALAAKDAALAKLAEEKAAADMRIAELERMLADEREAHLAAVRERDRLQGECGRLSGELRKTAQEGAVAAPPQAAPIAQSKRRSPHAGFWRRTVRLSRRLPEKPENSCWRPLPMRSIQRGSRGGNAGRRFSPVCLPRIGRPANSNAERRSCGRF